MPDIDFYIIEDEEVNEEEFVPCAVVKYNIYLEHYDEECFKDVKRLPLGLSKKSTWDYSIHIAHKMFQYWLYLVYKILHLSDVTIEMKELLIYSLNKDLLLYNTNNQHVLIYDTSLFNCMPDIDFYIIEDEEVNEEEFVPCAVVKYNIYLEHYDEECFKDVKRLPLELSKKSAWDYSIHIAHKMFQYWLYLVYKILHLSDVTIEMKELLIYSLNKDLLLYNTNNQHVLIFNHVIYKLEHKGGLMSPKAELNYIGHYSYPNMCNCTKYSTISSDKWKIFTSPPLQLVFNYPCFLNSDNKWTYAVYNCTCIHKLVAIMRSTEESNLNYWDEVIVINKFVSDVI